MSTDHNLTNDFQEKSSIKTLGDRLAVEIETNLNNDQFGVDSLAHSVGMSRSSLHRKLHKAIGISTSQFIREYRLKRAREILRQEDISVSEAAYRVGFGSSTYFCTSFHKFYGYTPGEVKSRIGNEVEVSIKNEDSAIGKNRTKKRALWLAMTVIVFLTAGLYYYITNKDEKSLATTGAHETKDKSIAVLPFKNWTGDPDLEYVSDGMTDAVISRLTKINSIGKVTPFTSTLQYKGTKKTINEIATELGIENLLQGNLQISGDKIKINLQLIDASTNNHFWTEEYIRDWKTDEIFKIQAEVVEGIAANMNAVIAKDELADIKKIPTKSKEAYSYYLQAEFQRNKANELSYTNAISLYEKAVAIDPNFVEAYLSMANIWSFGGLVWGIFDERLAWNNAKDLLEKALKLDPSNKEVEEELYSGYFYFDWNFEKVEIYYERMLKDSFFEITPAINADYAIKTGRYQNAIDAIDELLLKDPSVGILYFFKAQALMYSGDKLAALTLLNNADLLYNDNWYLRESAKLHFYLGEYGKSRLQLKKILSQFTDYPPILMWMNAVFAQMEGDLENTNKYLAELREKYKNGSSGSPAWFLAMYYCTVEDYKQTFDWLQKSYDQHEVEMTWLREEPLLVPLRNHPRYKDLYGKVGFSSIGLPIITSSEE
jgi:TolB-like protein/AraC-like DNA-binding protein/Tfp pilus assembly protein PilF